MPRVKLVWIVLVGSAVALALALALKFLLFAPKPREADREWTLSIEPQKPILVAAPGEFVTQVFSLSYKAPEDETLKALIAQRGFELSLKAPDDWQVLGLDEANPITLKGDGSRRVFVTVRIPPFYPAGEYHLRLQPVLKPMDVTKFMEQSPSIEIGSPRAPAHIFAVKHGDFTVRVKKAAIPKVEPRSPRAEVDPGRMPLALIHFVVTNQGNVRGGFELEALAPEGWRISPHRKRVDLSPGESEEVSIGLIIPEGVPPGVGEVILQASAKGYEARAVVKVTVLPH